MKKNNIEKKGKKIYLPISILVTYSLLLLIMVLSLVFIAPLALEYMRHYLYSEIASPDIIVLLFFLIILMIIVLVAFLLFMNERIKRRNKSISIIEDNSFFSTYSKLDSDRSYLEQQIADLTDKLLSSQKRWEDVNHLIISSHNKNINSSGVVSSDSFLENFNINPDEFTIDKRLVFLLTPFHEDHYDDYKAVKNTCADLGFNTIRGDEEHIKGDVLSHIIRCIIKSRIIIANINGRNPNVFYELGIAHTLNKPTILISHIENDIPFDLKTQYVIIYKDENELAEQLKKLLLQILID